MEAQTENASMLSNNVILPPPHKNKREKISGVIELTFDFPFEISSIMHPEGSFQERVGAASWSCLMKS